MLISITDPNDSAVVGQLFNADIIPEAVLQGGQFSLFLSSTGSDDNAVLFDLSEPPSFFGSHMVWGSIDEQGTLNLFLAPTTGDETHPFAQLQDFQELVGQGDLTRSNKLPPVIDWVVSP